jgi:3-methyladenine DNA glycosylase AlkD
MLLDRHARRLTAGALPALRRLITTKPWWDTVDSIRKPLGMLVLGTPLLKDELRAWNAGDDRWLVRSSIIVQLGFKQRTDQAFLFEMCANRASDREFFVRKGIGWALREYSKVDGTAVRQFVAAHPELSPLSQREALKWLERRGCDPR